MLIVGKNSDDKGTQLETLVQEMLRHQGFVNVVTNEIRSGGEEIDVRGDFVIPGPGETATQTLLAECKAYKTPIAIDVWHKFLGKIYSEEKRTGEQVRGCLIAPSGANGNCSGAYRDFRLHSKNITLIDRERVKEIVREMYGLAPEAEVAETVKSWTDRTATTIEPLYYDNQMYWFVKFDDSRFTTLKHTNSGLKTETSLEFVEMVASAVSEGTFVDLAEEKKATDLFRQRRSMMVGHLLMRGGMATFEELARDLETSVPLTQGVAEDLQKTGIVRVNYLSIELNAEQASNADVLKTLLSGPFSVYAIDCEEYLRRIDDSLVDYALKVQSNLPLSEEMRKEVLSIFKISPTAIGIALKPMELIAGHVRVDGSDPINELDQHIFFEALYDAVRNDYRMNQTHAHFYSVLGIVELETNMTIALKGKTGAILKGGMRSRVGLRVFGATPPAKEQLILIRMRNDMTEPWEAGEEFPKPNEERDSRVERTEDIQRGSTVGFSDE